MSSKEPVVGRLYGVGVGPGDPELLTLKACRILSLVPVIFVPQKSDESESIARSIIVSQVKDSESKIVGLVFPMLRNEEQLIPYWEKAAESIWQQLEIGNDCAFVNVGDPLLYGTFIHILRTLQSRHPQVPVDIIPGISSANAAAAATVFPLATNNERVAVISAERDEAFLRETLKNFDTVVIFKVNMIFHKLLDILEEMNLLDRCLYVRRCSTPEQEIIRDVGQLRGSKVDYFSILLVRRRTW